MDDAGTVTGMLAGARLARIWHHSRARRFFAAARWSADAPGLVLLDLITSHLLAPDARLVLVVVDTLFRRVGRKVWSAAWPRRPLARGGKGRKPVAWAAAGSSSASWSVCRSYHGGAVCLPVLACLWRTAGQAQQARSGR